MASHFEIFDADQENRAAGVRRGKAEMNQERKSRPVLGEIQNVNAQQHRRQPKRAVKQATGGGFQIYCDENAGAVPKQHPITSNSRLVADDKENFLPAFSKTLPSTTFPGLQARSFPTQDDLRQSQTRAVQLHPSLRRATTEDDQMNESVVSMSSESTDSPMVLDNSTAQWRVPPIENNETVDIFSVPEYSQDIYKYLRDSETKHMPKWNYMSKQPDITYSMRSILVDWLVEVAEEYKLQAETLYLAVSYIDRFLSYMSVQRAKLQLVGTACMFIASKYEEIYPPDVGEFVYITDDTYTKKQVLRMEHLVLKVLGFDLSVPTTHLFVNKYCQMFKMDQKSLHLATYLNELSLLDGESFLKFSPSVLAAASVALSRHTLGLEAWSDEMATSAGYQLDDLKECLVTLHGAFVEAETNPQQAIRDKYKSSKLSSVADISPPNIM
jgi:cyclin A